MTFNNFLQDIIFEQQIIKQGGNAFTNVIPIKKQFIVKTIQNFINQILFPVYHISPFSDIIFPLGSTGKKSESGDIDLAINVLLLKTKDNFQQIIKKIYTYTKLNTNIQVIYNPISNDMLQFAYPIYDTNQFVQIDLLFTIHPTFTKWYMHSPQIGQSKYKAAHRNELLRAIPKAITLDQLQYKDGELVKWKQQDINNKGVYLQTQTLIDKNGNRLMYKNTQLLLPQYAQIENQKEITHSPINTYKRYVGNINPYQVHSFQQLFSFITSKQFKFFDAVDDILLTARKMFENNEKLEFPQELT